jgi:putative transposase
MPYWRLFYHFVWGTKGREPATRQEWQGSLHNAIAAKATDLGALVHGVGGTEDHVHLVASVPPRVALSVFVGQVKGSSSHFVNHEIGPEMHFAWQNEYGVTSFDGGALKSIAGYARDQAARHAEERVDESLERVSPEDVGM